MPFDSIATGIAPSSAPISDANRAGNFVWLVAIAEDPETGVIIQSGIEEQTRQTLRNLEQGVRAAGGTLSDIVDVRVFLVDRADAKGMNAVYAEFFKTKPYPVRATGGQGAAGRRPEGRDDRDGSAHQHLVWIKCQQLWAIRSTR